MFNTVGVNTFDPKWTPTFEQLSSSHCFFNRCESCGQRLVMYIVVVIEICNFVLVKFLNECTNSHVCYLFYERAISMLLIMAKVIFDFDLATHCMESFGGSNLVKLF